MFKTLLPSIITCIISAILTPLIKIVMEKIRSIKDKPRFFIYELFFKGFHVEDENEEKKEYQIKGRLVGNTNSKYHFKSIIFELPYDCRWKSLKYSCYKKGNKRKWDKSKDAIESTITNNISKIEYSKDLGESTTYDVIGNYIVPNEPKDLSCSYSFLDVYSETKENDLRIKKCPNIRKGWLLFYIFFSMFVLFLGTASILGCINNWKYFVNANFELYFVFGVFGLLLLILMVFFVCVCWKTLTAYFVLIKMKKFDIPLKTEKVAQKVLVRTIFEFMTGTETIDNVM